MATLTPEQIKERDDALVKLPGYGVTGRADWLAIDWSTYLHRAMIDGRDLNYLRFGDPGLPTVVLVHGLAGCWQNWLANVVGLSQHFHVVALDLPGFGDSPMPTELISIEGYAGAVTGLMDHLEVERAHLIGNSMGGLVSLRAAIDHPSRFERMVLVSPAGMSTSVMPAALDRVAGVAGLFSARMGSNREAIVRRPKLRQAVLGRVVAHPEKLEPEIAYELIGGDGNLGFAASLRAIFAHDLRDELEGLSIPTLLIWGNRDGVIGYGDLFRFGRKIPGARTILLDDTGHVAMVEHPEWFDRTASEFLLAARD